MINQENKKMYKILFMSHVFIWLETSFALKNRKNSKILG